LRRGQENAAIATATGCRSEWSRQSRAVSFIHGLIVTAKRNVLAAGSLDVELYYRHADVTIKVRPNGPTVTGPIEISDADGNPVAIPKAKPRGAVPAAPRLRSRSATAPTAKSASTQQPQPSPQRLASSSRFPPAPLRVDLFGVALLTACAIALVWAAS